MPNADPVIALLESVAGIISSGGDPTAAVNQANNDGRDGAFDGHFDNPGGPATGDNTPGQVGVPAGGDFVVNKDGTIQWLPVNAAPGAPINPGSPGVPPTVAKPGLTPAKPAAPGPLAATPATQPGQTPTTVPGQAVTPQSLLNQFLESDPQLMLGLVGNKLQQGGASSQFLQWYQRNGQNFLNEYKGYLAEQANAGLIPTLSFVQFITGKDMMNAYFADSSVQRGFGPAASNTRLGDLMRTGTGA